MVLGRKVVSQEPKGEWLIRPHIFNHMVSKGLVCGEGVIKDFFGFWGEMKILSNENMEYYL